MPGAREDSKRNAGSLRNGVTDGREPPLWGLGIKARPSERAVSELTCLRTQIVKKLGMVVSSWNPIVGKLDQADPGAC